jgi:hypothetical protein
MPQYNFKECVRKIGHYKHGDKMLALIQQPFAHLDFNYTPNMENFEAKAIDEEGNLYEIRWEILDTECVDASEACDWQNPYICKMIEEDFCEVIKE